MESATEEKLAVWSLCVQLPCLLDTLPQELLYHIVSFLDPISLVKLACTCRKLLTFVNRKMCWFLMYRTHASLDTAEYNNEIDYYALTRQVVTQWKQWQTSTVSIRSLTSPGPIKDFAVINGFVYLLISSGILYRLDSDTKILDVHTVGMVGRVSVMDFNSLSFGLFNGDIVCVGNEDTLFVLGRNHTSPITALCKKHFLYVGTLDGFVSKWDVADKTCLILSHVTDGKVLKLYVTDYLTVILFTMRHIYSLCPDLTIKSRIELPALDLGANVLISKNVFAVSTLTKSIIYHYIDSWNHKLRIVKNWSVKERILDLNDRYIVSLDNQTLRLSTVSGVSLRLVKINSFVNTKAFLKFKKVYFLSSEKVVGSIISEI
jgi:hypothetical protein